MAILRSQEIERDGATRRRSPEGASADAAGPALHPLLTLQQQVGNASIARMLAQREGAPEEEELQAKHDLAQREGEEEEELQAKHDFAQREDAPEEEELQAKHDFAQREGEEEEELQAKHDLAQREEEEDEMAQAKHDLAQREGEEDVGANPDTPMQAKHDLAQREGEEDVGANPDTPMQAKPEVGLEGGPVSGDIASRIQAQRGGGSALDTGTQSSMEAGFGTSFKDVRVHTDGEADALNRSISAKAFTTGNDIFFRKDTSPTDHNLLAHELTHVVQQRSMSGSGGGMTVGPAGDSHEQQADSMASAVASGAAQRAQQDQE